MNSPQLTPGVPQRPVMRGADGLPEPAGDEREDVVWQELQAMFRWYDRSASRNRIGYQCLKVLTLVLAAAVAVLAAQHAVSWLTASLAAVIVAVEGMQQLFQLHANWISYRASAETLRQEAFAYVAGVTPYDDAALRRGRLAKVLRAVAANETTAWAKNIAQPS